MVLTHADKPRNGDRIDGVASIEETGEGWAMLMEALHLHPSARYSVYDAGLRVHFDVDGHSGITPPSRDVDLHIVSPLDSSKPSVITSSIDADDTPTPILVRIVSNCELDRCKQLAIDECFDIVLDGYKKVM